MMYLSDINHPKCTWYLEWFSVLANCIYPKKKQDSHILREDRFLHLGARCQQILAVTLLEKEGDESTVFLDEYILK